MKPNKILTTITQSQLIKIFFLLILFITIHSIGAYAQTPPGLDPDVPIDGGLSLLLAAGVGYGIKELRKKKGVNNK
jgi:hypothetical protein